MAVSADDKKKYVPLENVLNKINKDFIALSEQETTRNNIILRQLIDLLIEKMEKNNLFREMYSRIFYGGSFYDGLRVGQPDEFDLDLLFTIPKPIKRNLTTSNVPGYVHLQLQDVEGYLKQNDLAVRYRNFGKLLDEKSYLDNQKVRQWMEGVVQTALNDFEKHDGRSVFKIQQGTFYVKHKKGGPAFTLKVTGNDRGKPISLDIDLVPCFEFKTELWPTNGYRPYPAATCTKPNFFIVPKPMKADVSGSINRYWRLSFQEQERELIDNKQYLKPAVKLLKKLRDVADHKAIASYYIKTVVMWETEKRPNEFWRSSLSYVFMTLLKQYYEALRIGKIQYYWYKGNDLIKYVPDTHIANMANRIKFIIDDIERHLIDDPSVVAKYLLTPDELLQFKTMNLKL